MKIYRKIGDPKVDRAILQSDLELTSQWAGLWQLTLSEEKCVRFSLNKIWDTTYTLNNRTLPNRTVVKDLGVHIENDLKWGIYCGEIAKKGVVYFELYSLFLAILLH